jgi:hypothetical protein
MGAHLANAAKPCPVAKRSQLPPELGAGFKQQGSSAGHRWVGGGDKSHLIANPNAVAPGTGSSVQTSGTRSHYRFESIDTHKPKGMTIADNLRHLSAIGMHEAVLNTEAPRSGAEDGWFLEVH